MNSLNTSIIALVPVLLSPLMRTNANTGSNSQNKMIGDIPMSCVDPHKGELRYNLNDICTDRQILNSEFMTVTKEARLWLELDAVLCRGIAESLLILKSLFGSSVHLYLRKSRDTADVVAEIESPLDMSDALDRLSHFDELWLIKRVNISNKIVYTVI